MLKGGGHNKFWGHFYVVARSFSHIVGPRGGGAKSFYILKGGGGSQKVLPCLEGGGGAQIVLDPQFFHLVAPLSL